ncbi:MAG TPA: acyloxyacyl hydrolase [Telluria sp.]|nr:acyloxyacyl hydrolase [Telluria sp.]
MQSRTLTALATLMIVSLAPAPASAIDSASFALGDGVDVAMIRFGIQSNWEKRWFDSNGTHVSGYWDATLAQWRGTAYRGISGQHQNLTDIGLTPMFRLRANDGKGWYLEGGIGLHYLSTLYDNDGHKLSTRYQFGDQLGAGYVFQNGWDAGLSISHISNGGIKKPNSGVNFLLLRAKKSF